MTNFAIAAIFSSVVFLTIFTLFSILNYKNRFNIKYDIRNHYPYELNYEGKFTDNLTGNLAVILFALSGVAFFTLFDSKYNNGFFIFDMIAGSIYALALMSLAFIPLKNLKAHLFLVLACVVLSFLIPFSNALASSISFKDSQEPVSLVMMIVNAVYCVFIFILMMNPKLSHWADLKEETNNDGTKKYVRPKYFILAFIEWLLIFTSPVVMILSLLTKQFII